MPTFLFWNIQKKPILHRVARICARHAVDVVVLVENSAAPAEVLAILNGVTGAYEYPFAPSDRIPFFVRSPELTASPLFTDALGRLSIRELSGSSGSPFLIAAMHLPSPHGWRESDRMSIAQRLTGYIRETEDRCGTTRTVLVGDLNLNPFDDAMINGEVFHALMTKELAARRNGRVIQGERRRTFYNPMWQFMTDRGTQPSGTYYFHESVPVNHYWHAYDQVLVRPELIDKLTRVEILTSDGMEPLVSENGWPDEMSGSDHLPLLFQLDW